MGLSVDLVAAPATFVRASTRCDEVYGSRTMMFFSRYRRNGEYRWHGVQARVASQIRNLSARWILMEVT